ncbi:hypothetical protein [Longimicrobium sp.]|uniref:hypothetical protein n=1 Tax=Longimicrobium sp. TaxID=2029185 RepID=UPI002C9050E9|nr:hypothetical protein [Longimicrobium sp.]HSU16454.1 hypothetical protein [Longimicrobium sp.]
MKPLLAYAALVGLPLAGLAAVLHAGRALHAPPDVGGRWEIEWPRRMVRPPTAGELEEMRFTVAQSGTHVAVTLFGREYRGRLRGDSLVVRSGGGPPRDNCWDAPHTVIRARVDTAAAPRRMAFALESPSRDGCEGPYTAARIGRRPGEEGRR